jgi:hypothetical protein
VISLYDRKTDGYYQQELAQYMKNGSAAQVSTSDMTEPMPTSADGL